ncbi:MAG: methyltransferase domain-containing protein [Halodesulfurarchaeum sp.]
MILLVRDDREIACEPGEDVHTDLGVIQVPADPEPGDVVESHLGETFRVRALRGPDLFSHLERTGAPMVPKDIGLLIGHTGAAAGDRVLDAGTGTGILAAYLGRLGADVVTYERDGSFAEVARENMERAGVADTVEVRQGDVVEALDDLADFDLLTLDTEDAPVVVERAPDILRAGGFLATFSPFVEAAREVEEAAREAGLGDIETLETIQRRMDFDERGSRPTTTGVGHTGYLTLGRAP